MAPVAFRPHAGQRPASSVCREITDAVKNRARVSFDQTLITSDRISAARLYWSSGFLFVAAVFDAPKLARLPTRMLRYQWPDFDHFKQRRHLRPLRRARDDLLAIHHQRSVSGSQFIDKRFDECGPFTTRLQH